MRSFMRRLALLLAVGAFFGCYAEEIAPVASYYQFEVRDTPSSPIRAWDLWVIRPQRWQDGIAQEVFIQTTADGTTGPEGPLRDVLLSPDQRRALFTENRALSGYLLRSVYRFRLASVLRDYRVADESRLPPAIQAELDSIQSGRRAFAVLLEPGGMGPEAIELVVGVSHDVPAGILSERRLSGRAVLEDGSLFGGYAAAPAGLQWFDDFEFQELGSTASPTFFALQERQRDLMLQHLSPIFFGFNKARQYVGGATAELTTFARNDKSTADLVPALHQFLVTLGLTRFGLAPVEESEIPSEWKSLRADAAFRRSVAFQARVEQRERKWRGGAGPSHSLLEYQLANRLARMRRVSRLTAEAISFPGGKNALSRMYQGGMGFALRYRIPRDPDFTASSTDLLEISAADFETKLSRRLRQRPGGVLLEKGRVIPKFIHFAAVAPGGAVIPPAFLHQPSHDRAQAKAFIAEVLADPANAEAIRRADEVKVYIPPCYRQLYELAAGNGGYLDGLGLFPDRRLEPPELRFDR